MALGVVAGAALGMVTYAADNFLVLMAEMPEFPHGDRRHKRLAESEQQFAAAKNSYDRWSWLPSVALGNAVAGDLERAERLADEVLEMAAERRSDWNYGNAIHKGHLAKGHAALKRGDREGARRHLLAAGDTPGSPQLNSFGPNMDLARELLLAGDRDVVLAYLDKLEKFWEHDGGALRKWREMIREGRNPNFAVNLF